MINQTIRIQKLVLKIAKKYLKAPLKARIEMGQIWTGSGKIKNKKSDSK